MGPLKIVSGGIELSGQALIMDHLRASSIRSRFGQPLNIDSFRNFTVRAHNNESPGGEMNQIFFGQDRFEVSARALNVTDPSGATLFYADRDEVVVGANALQLDGEGGITFSQSIQTPLISAEAGKSLKYVKITYNYTINKLDKFFFF